MKTNSKFDQNNQTGDLNAQINPMAGSSHPFQQRPTIMRIQPAFPSPPQHTVINQLMNQTPQQQPPPQFAPYQNQYLGWGGFPHGSLKCKKKEYFIEKIMYWHFLVILSNKIKLNYLKINQMRSNCSRKKQMNQMSNQVLSFFL